MSFQGTKIKKRLKTLRAELEECIEPQYGLLTKLVSSDVFSMREFENIESKRSDSHKQCVKLLNVMLRKTPNECEQFIADLNYKDQKHVVNYIIRKARRFEKDHSEYLCWPLTESHRKRITRNMDQLGELIFCDGLIATLYSRGCINYPQVCSLTQVPSSDIVKSKTLLTMLLRRSIRDYNVFIEFLQESEMSFLAPQFQQDFVIETVDCTIAGQSVECERTLEGMIVSKFWTLCKVEQSLGWISGVVRNECHPKTKLVAMKVGHSIRCFFLCETPDALRSLYTSISDKSLINTMQSIFQHLLGREESVSLVEITGRLNSDEQKKRVSEFRTDLGSHGATKRLEELSVTEKPFQFPYEVLEPILLRAAVELFKVYQVRLLLPRPDVTTLVTIGSVCRDWWEVITGRRLSRRKLKLAFRKSKVALSKAEVHQQRRHQPSRGALARRRVKRRVKRLFHW